MQTNSVLDIRSTHYQCLILKAIIGNLGLWQQSIEYFLAIDWPKFYSTPGVTGLPPFEKLLSDDNKTHDLCRYLIHSSNAINNQVRMDE